MSAHKAFRTVLSALAVCALLLAAGAGPARAQLGLGAGLNFNDLGDIESGSADATFGNSTGYHVGAFYRIGFGPLDLEPGVFYHRIGDYTLGGTSFDLNAVEVPVDVQLGLFGVPAVGVYLLGAPVLTFPRAEEGFEDAVQDLSLSADIGFGLEISPPGSGLTLMPEFRYSTSVSSYMGDSFQVGGTTVTPSDDDRNLSKIMLRLNILF